MNSYFIASLITLIIIVTFTGCIEEKNVNFVSGTIGEIPVKGDVDSITITSYQIHTKIYNHSKSSSENIEGFEFSSDTLEYKISVTAKNTGNITFSMVNISVQFYRDEQKGRFFIGEKSYAKYEVDPEETWNFPIRLSRTEKNFGPVAAIDFKIIATQ